MYTYKFLGLSEEDAETPYYYGSLRKKAELGQTLNYDETNNRYVIIQIEGEGLEGHDGPADQRTLAWADIGARQDVPTLTVRLATPGRAGPKHEGPDADVLKEGIVQGRSFDADEVKAWSQQNRKYRIANPSQ
jgi:hypothetical protein